MELNLVIAGTDPVAVDAVGAAVMNKPPDSVEHLRLADERELGTSDLKQVEILDEPIEKVKKKFKTSFLFIFLVNLG